MLLALNTALCVLELESLALPHPGKLLRQIGSAVSGLRFVLTGRRPIALLALALVSYGASITIRRLWLVPMFVERYGLTLLAADNVALALSIAVIVAPAQGWNAIDAVLLFLAGTLCLGTIAFAMLISDTPRWNAESAV